MRKSIGLLHPKYVFLLFFILFISPINAIAETNSDSEVIFNWGESNFSQFFPEHRLTLTAGPWKFRHYPSTNVFLGVKDGQVFVLGGPFGNKTPSLVATVAGLRAQIGGDPGVPACNNPEDGFTVTQNENIVNITSNGQCLTLPNDICQTSFASAPTGNSVLSTTTLTSTSFTGLEFEDPSDTSKILDLFNVEMGDKLCTLNTPPNLINLVTNKDICRHRSLSISDRGLAAEFDLILLSQGIRTNLRRSMTHQLTATTTNQLVPDCFATDADVVFDLFTGESWIRQEGGGFSRNPANTTPGQLIRQVKAEKFDKDFEALVADGELGSRNPTQTDGQTLAINSGCLNCHNVETRLVGPALVDVSAKYSNDTDAIQYLTSKILNGSNSVWGLVPMPPNAMVTETNAMSLAEWILSLNNTARRTRR